MTQDNQAQGMRERTLARYLDVWQGKADVATIDALVTADFVGHMGSRSRGLNELKRDIAAYRASAGDVHFVVEHRFAHGDFIATRLTAHAHGQAGERLVAAGLNVSRWSGDRLAEEWAVWEPLHPAAPVAGE